MDTIGQIDAFFSGKPERWALFDALQRALQCIYPDMQLRVMKTCIVIEDPNPFLYVSFPPRKRIKGLWLSISLHEAMEHPRIAVLVPVSRTRYTAHVHLEDEQGINRELLELITLGHR